MTEGIVYVTDQGTKHELQFAYDILKRQDMKPFWIPRSKMFGEFVVARPAFTDDPKCIVKDAEVDGMIGVRP